MLKLGLLSLIFLCRINIIRSAKATITCPKSCACDNKRMKCDGEFPAFIPSEVTDVELFEIESTQYVDGVFCKTSWNNVRQLTMVCLNGCHGYFTMENDTFRCLQNIESITLSFDFLNDFDIRTFYGLPNVTSLYLNGCVRICTPALETAFSDSNVLPMLSELSLHGVGSGRCLVQLNQTFVDLLGVRYLQTLRLTSSFIVFNHPNFKPLCDTLTAIYLTNSTIDWASKVDLNQHCPSLQLVDLSGAHFPRTGILPFAINFTNVNYFYNFSNLGSFVTNVENLYINYLLSKDYTIFFQNSSILFSGRNKFRNIELCGYNFIKFDLTIRFKYNHLRRIALAYNNMASISGKVFQNHELLEEIDLSNNRLAHSSSFKQTFQQLFRKNKLLNKIDISNNELTYVPSDTFESNTLLSSLYLSGNAFKQIMFDVESLLYLTLLEMQNNSIIHLDAISRNALDALHRLQKFQHNTAKENRTIQVDLRGNPFSCVCDSLDFIKWFVNSPLFIDKHQYTCQTNGHSFSMTENVIRAAEEDCERPIRHRRTIILASVVPSVMLMCAVGIIVVVVKQRRKRFFRQRFDDRVRLLQDDCVEFRFLVFLSFSSEDDQFVMKNVLIPLQVRLFSKGQCSVQSHV